MLFRSYTPAHVDAISLCQFTLDAWLVINTVTKAKPDNLQNKHPLLEKYTLWSFKLLIMLFNVTDNIQHLFLR